MKNISIKLVPYEALESGSVKDILADLQKNTIVVIDAKISPQKEAEIIQETMAEINEKFSGIEISSFDISKDEETDFLSKLRGRLAEILLGKKRGLTVIGPADIIKKIKKDPKELMVHLS
ncbi:DUF2073 domain-containing protein [archaeon]|nr:DUF2073 domain-containing protein [archaeon]